LSVLAGVAALACLTPSLHAQTDPLSSWHDGASKRRIVEFVKAVTEPGGRDYVAPDDRIAVFDNDGTLWSEQPLYFQAVFALEHAKAMAAKDETLAALAKAAKGGDQKAHAELLARTYTGNTTDEFAALVREWTKSAIHPTLKRRYVELTYSPMTELLDYLRANGFKIWIVSGGGSEFLRAIAMDLYGVQPERVIGSTIKTRYEVRDGGPVIVRLPELDFVDDKEGKVIGIHKFIGGRPIAAFGNSDGDFQMLEWTTTGPGVRLGLIVHHDDAAREFAYDRETKVGKLARGLDEAAGRGWTVVSMKRDWRVVYPPAR
jgi:phosphoserine phosphatase